jgi:hypothetical protein
MSIMRCFINSRVCVIYQIVASWGKSLDMQRFFFLIAACCLAVSALAGDGPTVVASSLQSVMVYRSGAEMVHAARARLVQGSSELIIEVELLDNGGAAVNKDNGILTWKLELAPGQSQEFRISYSIKYPKDKTVNIN